MGQGKRAPGRALIDIGSTYSYVACSISENLGIPVESTSSEVIVLSPLGQSIRVRKMYRGVFLDVQGMNYLANVISALVAEKLVRKGYEAYLAYVSVFASGDSTIKDIRIMRDFSDLFLEELLSLPLNQEVEFGIELLPGTTLVSIAPYRMAPKEFTELKAQIQELLDCRFIRPSVSP
ncbi:uncharacterized protein LOC128039895 [Gossypium raimondii]|uniref:uncharacterized protein LOC128039895 n=1 Tax=Gossypium raimondii TaxID=29730 RepID=UPI00227B5935|nr:uncharacterized protein LOC128039895 [Gossypium raimondii]